jgi:hypothetical protein
MHELVHAILQFSGIPLVTCSRLFVRAFDKNSRLQAYVATRHHVNVYSSERILRDAWGANGTSLKICSTIRKKGD